MQLTYPMRDPMQASQALSPNYSIFYAGDAYSTAQKIMGRQSAGKQLIRGLATKYVEGKVNGIGPSRSGRQSLELQLQSNGYRGELGFEVLPRAEQLKTVGTLYYPAPPTRELAHWRERVGAPQAFSLMGVTHTLSSKGAADQIADLVLPPFETWDALICTSRAAQVFVRNLQAEMKAYLREALGASRFTDPQTPIIPLGIDTAAFARTTAQIKLARERLAVAEQEVVFFFAGRLSFHAKANPLPMYWALEQASLRLKSNAAAAGVVVEHHPDAAEGGVGIVCLEAGVFPNEHIEQSFKAAQRAIAPHVRFLRVNGQDEIAYRVAWQAADVFVSLSDNIQETFGLTPVEAMAAGLPVLIADWNGYQDTVRHDRDGFKVPTVQAPAGAGESLALRHMLDVDTYDMYIGRASLATVVEPAALAGYTFALASDKALRERMGAEGRRRAISVFDWSVVLDQYHDLSEELRTIRQIAKPTYTQQWPARSDPFKRFAHFSTGPLQSNWMIRLAPQAQMRLGILASLAVANYGFDEELLPKELPPSLLNHIASRDGLRLNELIEHMGGASEIWIRALMWLWKFDLIRLADH